MLKNLMEKVDNMYEKLEGFIRNNDSIRKS